MFYIYLIIFAVLGYQNVLAGKYAIVSNLLFFFLIDIKFMKTLWNIWTVQFTTAPNFFAEDYRKNMESEKLWLTN